MSEKGEKPRTNRNFDLLVNAIEVSAPMLMAGALQMTRHREDAEDVVQDTYLKAVRGFEKFRGDSEISTWLMRIMKNSALDRKDLRVYSAEVSVDPESLTGVAGSDLPEDSLLEREGAKEVLASFGQLSPDESKVLVLQASGFKMEEISEKTGMPAGTIKSHLHRARQKLQTLAKAA